MPYEFTEQGKALLAGRRQLHGRPHLPERGRVPRAARGARPRRRPADPRQAEGGGTRARAVEPVPPAPGARRPRHEALEPRLRADLRAARQGRVRVRGAELRRARHRQHGDPQPVRLRDGQARLAGAAARGRDPLGVLDDRARRRLVRRHQHRPAHRARRRRVRPQRHEVVLAPARCAERCKVLIVMGKTDPNAPAPPAAVDDRRAQGRAGRPHRPHAARVRLRPRAAAIPRSSTRTCACRPTTSSARRAAASPSPRPASGQAASTTACARSAWPSGPSSCMVDRALAAHARSARSSPRRA